MALTFTTGMTQIASGDSTTNYNAVRWSGSGSAPGIAAADDFVEGTGAIQSKLAGNNWVAAVLFDYYTANSSTVLNMTTAGNEIICGWFKYGLTPQSLAVASGGLFLAISSSTETGTSTPTDYVEYYLGGNDYYVTSANGWVFFMVDTRKVPSASTGSPNLASVRRMGVGVRNDGTIGGGAKGEPFYLDSMWYGSPVYTVAGDGSTVASWDDFLTDSATTNVNGLIQDIGGALGLRCGIQFGTAAQSSTTTFDDATGTVVIFQKIEYHTGTAFADAVDYSDLYSIEALGNGATTTSVTFGDVVGSGDDRQGVQGGAIVTQDNTVEYSIDFETDIADLSAVDIYGVQFRGSGVQAYSSSTKTNIIGCTFTDCGEVQPNDAEFLNNTIISPKNRGVEMLSTHTMKQLNFIAGTDTGAAGEVGTRSNGTATAASSITVSHTTTSATELLVVFVIYEDDAPSAALPVNATFNGVGMELLVDFNSGNHSRTVLAYALRNPPTATANIVSNLDSNFEEAALVAYNVENAGVITVYTENTGPSSTDGTTDINLPSDAFLMMAGIALQTAASPATPSNLTERYDAVLGPAHAYFAGDTSTTGISAKGWTFGTNQNFFLVGVEVRGTGAEFHVHHNNIGDASVTYDDMQFFGFGAAGGPKWHGENSESAADITVSSQGTSNPAANEFEITGNPTEGTVTVSASVPVTITIVDASGGPIQNVQTSVYLSSDDSQVMNTDTNASGVATASFTGTTPAACYIRWRKSSTGTTRYVSGSSTGTIVADTGLSAQFIMQTDDIASA